MKNSAGDKPEFSRDTTINPPWADNYTTTGIDQNIWVDRGALHDDWAKRIEELQQQQTISTGLGSAKFELDHIVGRLERIESAIETLLNMMKLILTTQIEKKEVPQEELS